MNFSTFPFQDILNWYNKNGRHDLPWRKNHDPYFIWISEIFLQQTQVKRVIPYFKNVTTDFPSVHDFSQLTYEEFFPYYEGLGYYSRARNMLKTAQIITDKYQGVFPNNYKELLELPGVGPYTAQAILSFGYNQNILAFDTNIEKIFARYFFGSRFHKLSPQEKKEIQLAFENTNISGRIFNAAMMDFASTVDINDKINIAWDNYPLKKSKFYIERGINEEKIDKIKNNINKKDAEIIVFLHKDHKEYYSIHPDLLEPFILGKSPTDHRHFIKEYFKTHFDLSLSVRPAYKKISLKKGDYFFYHAQIQTGNHDFGIFTKKEKNHWEEVFLNN
ncbi:MAG: hypothetical protein GY828_02520 [Candidatus Gracilibacteria bacterium]|nr:hypothetical protein [Candidatus Gracilibacteria bacterium]